MDGAGLLRAEEDRLLSVLASAIAAHIPEFNVGIEDPRHPLRKQRQKVLRLSVTGMARAIEARHGRAHPPAAWGEHRELGRLECRHGRPLSEILRAPWAASRAILRYAAERADDAGLTPADVQEIAEVVIDWSDQISIAFSEGYNDESSARAGEMETRRQRLLELVLSNPLATPAALAAASRAAEWRVPRSVRVLVAHGSERHEFRRRLPPGSVVADIGEELCALLPEPFPDDQLRAQRPPPGTLVSLGPPCSLGEARRAAELARRAIGLAVEGVFDAARLIDCAELELQLLVFADPDTARSFSTRVLEPIAGRRDLLDTLAAWLAVDGRPKAAAARLGVHPHTVTYRLNLLRGALGSIVDDPDRRIELHLASYIHRAWSR